MTARPQSRRPPPRRLPARRRPARRRPSAAASRFGIGYAVGHRDPRRACVSRDRLGRFGLYDRRRSDGRDLSEGYFLAANGLPMWSAATTRPVGQRHHPGAALAVARLVRACTVALAPPRDQVGNHLALRADHRRAIRLRRSRGRGAGRPCGSPGMLPRSTPARCGSSRRVPRPTVPASDGSAPGRPHTARRRRTRAVARRVTRPAPGRACPTGAFGRRPCSAICFPPCRAARSAPSCVSTGPLAKWRNTFRSCG